MVSGQAPVVNGRKNKWRHAWLAVPVLVILAVGGSVYVSSNQEPSYDPHKAVFYGGHLYANFAPVQSEAFRPGLKHMLGVPVSYDTLRGPPTRAAEFIDDDGVVYGGCIPWPVVDRPPVSFVYPFRQPYESIVCREQP